MKASLFCSKRIVPLTHPTPAAVRRPRAHNPYVCIKIQTAEPKELPVSRHRAKEMGSKRHLAEPGRRRLLLRLALGLALIYGLRQHLTLRTAHDRLVALQALSSTTTPLQTPSAERFFAPRAAQPLREPSAATRGLIVAEADLSLIHI